VCQYYPSEDLAGAEGLTVLVACASQLLCGHLILSMLLYDLGLDPLD
jgi:hypothetical protein